MATLSKIVIQDWRNIELQELCFCPNVNCISGGNGQGKTNLLDAIHYLSMTKSAFGSSDHFNFRKGCGAFALSGTYNLSEGRQTRISVKVSENSEKKVVRDDKPYSRLSDHIGLIPVVMVSPADSALVSDGGDERRRFSNALLSQIDPEFLSAVQRYTKLLSQRNAALKSPQVRTDLIEIIDERLAPLALQIFEKRKAMAEELLPVVQAFHEGLCGGREQVGIEYKSDLQKGSLQSVFEAHFERDKALGYTTSGVQRDDFIFTMDGEPIRKVGSQGQQKSFLVSLKFAQYELMKKRYGFPPIMLLDDLFDKLDMSRTESLLKMVASEDFGQIFITDTDKVRLQSILGAITDESTFHEAQGGSFKKI